MPTHESRKLQSKAAVNLAVLSERHTRDPVLAVDGHALVRMIVSSPSPLTAIRGLSMIFVQFSNGCLDYDGGGGNMTAAPSIVLTPGSTLVCSRKLSLAQSRAKKRTTDYLPLSINSCRRAKKI